MPELPSPPSAFHGVRFFLHGFDPQHLHNVRSKLIDGGAVDAVQYGPNCTHVVVDNTVYDDPVCITARKDGKTVVTSLWLDHSFDVGLPVDASSVMYRPLKDLKGIPGAHSLIMCLTGYQRQDRDDIMTMVGLMGAQFSKPLVANKVTHLICYKFEGEKYELAKKIKKIKLVNHRWLEDCLKHWRILPEENYSRSGFELEMEAEAKDSEEETEDNVVEQAMEAANVKTVGMTSYSLPPTSADKPSDKLNNKSSAEDVSVVDAQHLTLTPAKKPSISGSSKDLNLRGCQDEGSIKAGSSCVLPEELGNGVLGDVSHKKLTTTLGSGGVSPFDAKYSSLSYSRKTPIRSPSTLFSGGRSGDVNISLNGKLGEVGDVTKGKMDDDIYTTRSRNPLKEIEVPGEVSRIKILHDKKPEAFCAHSNIQKSSSCAEPCILGSPFNRTEAQEKVADMIDQSLLSNTHCANEKPSIHGLENEPASVPTAASRDLALSRSPTSRNNCCDNDSEAVAQTSCLVPRKPSCDKNPSGGDIVEDNILHPTGELAKEEFPLQPTKIESPGGRGADTGKSFESGSKNVLGTINNKVATGPIRKKSMARKTLGCRTKINTSANRKGSICLSKAASNDGATRTEILCASDENSPMANMVEVSTLHDASEAVQEVKSMNVVSVGEGTVNAAVGMDDETEPPEEKNDFVCGQSINEEGKKVESEKKTAASSEGLHADAYGVITSKEGTRMNEIGITDHGQNHKPDESSTPGVKSDHSSAGRKSKAVHAVKKNIRRNKCADGERKDKMEKGRSASGNADKGNNSLTSRSSGKVEDKKTIDAGKGVTKEQEKMKCVSTTVGKGNNSLKSGSSRKVEEKQPVDEGERAMAVQEKVTCSVSKAKSDLVEPDKLESAVGRSCSKSGRKRMKANKEAEKSNANSTTVKASEEEAVQPAWFILSGSRPQRKEFQNIIRRLKGRFCRDSHQWTYQATHFIAPDPIRRTEKFFAAAASGSWILKSDYLKASSQAGKFLDEKPFEWHQKGLSQDGAINLEAPRKWRLLRENTGHGAFYGMRVVIYGECIAPPLDTLKRVMKAGGGMILATCPPYNKFLNSGVDFVIVSPGMPRVDIWVQEFLKHEIPCVVADYIVEYVCKPGYSLEKHVLYNTHAWAEKSFSRLQRLANEVVLSDDDNDLQCRICGSADRGEVMLICGDETGSVGCGIGTHIDCCNPPLEAVPEEDWLCPNCSKASKSTSSGGKRKRQPC